MWKGIVPGGNRGWTLEATRAWIGSLNFSPWRPSGGTLHNTAAPSLKQWIDYEATHPGQRILNLERYYRDDQHWSAGPHFFVDNKAIYPFTPLNQSGVHSPGFNATKFGVEMVGDYDVEDDDTGEGYKAKRLTAGLFAAIYSRLGLDPDQPGVFTMHRDDKLTHHKCPGDKLYNHRAQFLEMVKQAMGDAGDAAHPAPLDYQRQPMPAQQPGVKPTDPPPIAEKKVAARVGADGLNVRSSAGTGSIIVDVLPAGNSVAVYKTALNSKTEWSYIWSRLPNGRAAAGWVASSYLE